MQTFAALSKATLIPAAEFTVWLETQPDPGDLNGHGADVPVANLTDTQLTRIFATLMRQRGQTCQGADLAPVSECSPGKELHHEQPGTVDADATQSQELAYLLHFWLAAVSNSFLALGFQGLDLLLCQLEALILSQQASLQTG
jgi:hypothetical protein